MYRLIYISSAMKPFTDGQLQELLEVSRRNNEIAGITGMLLYLSGNFIQVLEGEKMDVLALVLRIGHDPRHRGVLVLMQGHVAEREFPNWSMGFHRVGSHEENDLPGYTDFLDQAANPDMHRSSALRLLDHFKQMNS